MITERDAGIGRVVDAVEQAGQWDNTLILFLGDNGYLCGSKGFQGKVRPLLTGGAFSRDAAFSSWDDGRPEALVARVAVEPYRVVRTPSHKYIVWESKKEALFDLKADPFEERNLAPDPAHAALLKRMKNRLRARMKETSDKAMAWL